MIPTLVLLASFIVLQCVGFLGVATLDNWDAPLRIALCLMFLITASAHWGRGRPDLIRMVPSVLPAAGIIVSITGALRRNPGGRRNPDPSHRAGGCDVLGYSADRDVSS